MGFLTKHYEKIILALFLLVFVLALVYLILVFSKSKEITLEDLDIKPEGENYSRIFTEDGKEALSEGEKGKYSYQGKLNDIPTWIHSEKKDPNSLDSCDFMVPYLAARCERCLKIIPKVCFIQKLCPLCTGDPGFLKKPDTNIVKDTDEDGMPDKFEKDIPGMNFEDPADKWTDLDRDGYSNFSEYNAKTKLNDSKSHPPLALRISLKSIKRQRIPIILKNITARRVTDKKEDWNIYYQTYTKGGRWTSEFKQLGNKITLYSKRRKRFVYKIIDAEIKKADVFSKRMNAFVEKNISEIKIQKADDKESEPITVVVGKSAYETKAILDFLDTVNNKEYKINEAGILKIGDETTGIEDYKVIEINEKEKGNEWIKIEDNSKKQFIIGKQSKLDQENLKRSGGVDPEDGITQPPPELNDGRPKKRPNAPTNLIDTPPDIL